jgi:multisubunit Na+/H+ antiporter MnhC subunit
MGLLLAAGTMLLVLGAAAVLHPRPGLRRAIGLVLVTQAVLLLRVGLAGPATGFEEITRAALLVAAAASASALARAITTTDGPEALE